MKILILIAAVLITTVTFSQKSDITDERAARITNVIDKAIAEKRIVGTVVLVAQNGYLVYHKAAGLRDRESNIPMTENTIFLLASLTKPIVSATAMKLIEEGKISLNDNISKYFPDFKPKLKNGKTPEITIRQLLTHTSGLSYRFLEEPGGIYDELNISDGLDQPGLSFDENLERLAMAPLKFEPGTKWNYSLSMDVLGRILEKASKKSLPDLVSEYVTTPLKMKNTGFLVTDKSLLATPYANGKVEPIRMTDRMEVPIFEGVCRFSPSRIFDKNSYPSGGGGMAGSAFDLLNFFETLRKGGSPILKKSTVKMMTTDQVGSQAETQGPGWGFGYGWAVLDEPKLTGTAQEKGTIQWGGAYGHRWFIDPVNNLTVIQLTNTTFEGMSGTFPEEITRAVYGN